MEGFFLLKVLASGDCLGHYNYITTNQTKGIIRSRTEWRILLISQLAAVLLQLGHF